VEGRSNDLLFTYVKSKKCLIGSEHCAITLLPGQQTKKTKVNDESARCETPQHLEKERKMTEKDKKERIKKDSTEYYVARALLGVDRGKGLHTTDIHNTCENASLTFNAVKSAASRLAKRGLLSRVNGKDGVFCLTAKGVKAVGRAGRAGANGSTRLREGELNYDLLGILVIMKAVDQGRMVRAATAIETSMKYYPSRSGTSLYEHSKRLERAGYIEVVEDGGQIKWYVTKEGIVRYAEYHADTYSNIAYPCSEEEVVEEDSKMVKRKDIPDAVEDVAGWEYRLWSGFCELRDIVCKLPCSDRPYWLCEDPVLCVARIPGKKDMCVCGCGGVGEVRYVGLAPTNIPNPVVCDDCWDRGSFNVVTYIESHS
jgi:predicted transcriptional regulator